MEHQDWRPLVLAKTPPKSSGVPQHTTPASNLSKLETDETYHPPMMTRELGLKISQGRAKLKLTQPQLAQKCSIPVGVVKQYEQGIGLYNRAYLDKLCAILDISLPRPAPKKTKE